MAKNKNTKPELIAQKLLDEMGIDFVTHESAVPGTPDIYIAKLKLAIFVHGCFWHKHSCQGNDKLDKNVMNNDLATINKVVGEGYIPAILWECELINDQVATKNRLKYLISKLMLQQQKTC
jgi:DNA mismatch endonuclease (patch repair protein)